MKEARNPSTAKEGGPPPQAKRLREEKAGRMAGLIVAFLATLQIAAAIAPHEAMRDPDQERRARALYQEVRCVVCQNESIADSSADIAADLRADVRTRIAEGKSDKEIREALVERYGDYVLFRPRLTAGNIILWAAPFLVLIAGIAAFVSLTRRSSSAPVAETQAPELSAEEAEALRRRLESDLP
jgi:cytochrome c-type biogenesis protein CcmH